VSDLNSRKGKRQALFDPADDLTRVMKPLAGLDSRARLPGPGWRVGMDQYVLIRIVHLTQVAIPDSPDTGSGIFRTPCSIMFGFILLKPPGLGIFKCS